MSARWLTEAQVEAYQSKRAGPLIGPTLSPLGCAVPAKAKRVTRSELEAELARQIAAAGIHGYRFDAPYLVGSRCRADILFQAQRLVVEVQGGCHVVRAKAHADIRKAAESLLQGWRLLPVDRDAIWSGDALRWIQQLLTVTKTDSKI
jgi:very-short-patch-repair endonuclease